MAGAEMTGRRVLVTGATGMIGAAIVRALRARERSVRVLARDPARARALFGSTVEIAAGDLDVAESLERACDGIGEIHHAAALLGLQARDDKILETNVEGTRRLLAAARGRGVTRIAFTSSVAVYGDRLGRDISENAPPHPNGAYGISKVRAEALLREAAGTGVQGVMVRPCIVYGAGDRYFLPQIGRIAALPLLPLPDGGRHLLDLVHAEDVATAHLIVMERGTPGEAYNATDGGSYPVRCVLRWIADALGRSPRPLPLPRWLASALVPPARIAGRLGGVPALAGLRRDEVDAFYTDHHFAIGKIRSLGYAPRIQAREGLRAALRQSP